MNKIRTHTIKKMAIVTVMITAMMFMAITQNTTASVSTITGTSSVNATFVPQVPVPLGKAGNFTILAKAGISTTGATAIVGDIGVSPVAATYVTGFGLALSTDGTYSNSSLVSGKVYAASYTEPTPTMLTASVGDMEIAYNNATGRSNPDYNEYQSGLLSNATNATLNPGLYKWSSSVTISTNVTLNGTASDVWVFVIAGDLSLASGKFINHNYTVNTDNVFWAVAGAVTLGTTSVFNGNILSKTGIVLKTGATLNGRALAQTAVTLDAAKVDSNSTLELPVVPPKPVTQVAVDLGNATDFSILAKSGITNTGASAILGDIGVSPIAATAIVGFDLTLNATYGNFSTSSLVNGSVYAADYAAPTPTRLGYAVTDMEAAYTNATNRINPDYTNVQAGAIGGLTLPAGLYSWTTAVTIGSNITLNGTSGDFWVFQVGGALSLSASKSVFLTGGANANRVFWAVDGAVVLGADSVFNGIILSTGAITLHTDAALYGKALSQTAVTLDSNNVNVVVVPPVVIPPPAPSVQGYVNLGSTTNFSILAKSGITTTGTTAILGNIGVSPIAATAMTGFALVKDSSNQFSTSSLVTGNVYAADYAAPTPTMMTTAISDMETAYNNASGRTNPDFVDLGAGQMGGLTLAPGLYHWGTAVLISTDVTLNGTSSDVWVFQITGALTMAAAVHVNLIGGAKANNVFWAVSGAVTVGAASVFNGNILGKTGITLGTGSTLNGRAFAQTAVTLGATEVNIPIPFVKEQTSVIVTTSTVPTSVLKTVTTTTTATTATPGFEISLLFIGLVTLVMLFRRNKMNKT